MPTIKKVVLTGGPVAGKTAILAALEYQYGDDLIVIPEVASSVLAVPRDQGGPGIPGADLEWSQEWQDDLQQRIFERQLGDEIIVYRQAQDRERDTLIVCDRGLLDGAAYLEGGQAEFLERFKLTRERCFAAYDKVIHLTSVAVDNPALYDELKETNPNRFEDRDRAQQLDGKILEVWEGHPDHIAIGAAEGIETKLRECLQEINSIFKLRAEIKAEISKELIQPVNVGTEISPEGRRVS